MPSSGQIELVWHIGLKLVEIWLVHENMKLTITTKPTIPDLNFLIEMLSCWLKFYFFDYFFF